jgi:hypothetical protein
VSIDVNFEVMKIQIVNRNNPLLINQLFRLLLRAFLCDSFHDVA